MADRVVRKANKTRIFEANLCGTVYSTFKTSFQPYRLKQTVANAFYRTARLVQGNKSL